MLLTRPYMGHDGIRACVDDTAFVRAMIRVEIALAEAEAETGLIPRDAARAIAALADLTDIQLDGLETGVAISGVPVPALLTALRARLDANHRDWLHWGATSQDIVDTAFCLCFGAALGRLTAMLDGLITALQKQAKTATGTIVLARTRGQLATPVGLDLRIAQWAQPLITLQSELPNLRAAALRVQFGGASGSRNATAPHGATIARHMADALDLSQSPPWHTDRNGFRRLANWLSRLISALAKIGRDLSIASRGEIAELWAGAGGGSSTMPHKANPVRAEALQTQAIFAAACESGLANAAIHAEERDGVMWPVEWAFLPALFEASGAALSTAQTLIDDLTPDAAAMMARIKATPAVYAEAILFVLTPRIGKVEAQKIVSRFLEAPDGFPDTLPRIDGLIWSDVLSDSAFTAPATEIAEEILRARRENRETE